SDLADRVNKPRSVRAVANAVGANPVALLIPCHRVIRKSGALGGYRWGEQRKQVIRFYEQVV
ncbi:MAG: methylated-DNA--[protein]-cysteine S-methyltransferase, partial [Gammaproteobacteria bacterium]|nr:methylated-DNA--[protein]-cysteine S-methyltransferase [Gammaproteobacteria bacterium]